MKEHFNFYSLYINNVPYADFGTKKIAFYKICVSGTVGLPYKCKNLPLAHKRRGS